MGLLYNRLLFHKNSVCTKQTALSIITVNNYNAKFVQGTIKSSETRHNKNFLPKNLKCTELSRCKSMGTSWMKLLNRRKKFRDKSVQLMTTNIIISHTHAPLQLTPNHITITFNDTVGDHNYLLSENYLPNLHA